VLEVPNVYENVVVPPSAANDWDGMITNIAKAKIQAFRRYIPTLRMLQI
jgi:hypothetical protein